MNKNEDGTFYVDFGRIRKQDGYVYCWQLGNFLKPTLTGHLSYKSYRQGDCKQFRYRILQISGHSENMGGGTPSTSGSPKNPQWSYPPLLLKIFLGDK